jgi:hypothetical protein
MLGYPGKRCTVYLLRKALEYVPKGQQGMIVELVRGISPRFTDDCHKAAAARVLAGAGGVDEDGFRSAQLRCTVVGQLHVWRRAGGAPASLLLASVSAVGVAKAVSRHDRRIDQPSTLGFGWRYAVAHNAVPLVRRRRADPDSSDARDAARHTRSVHLRRVRPMWLSLADQSAG